MGEDGIRPMSAQNEDVMTMQSQSTDGGIEVPGQLDLLNEIPGETRGSASGSEYREESNHDGSQPAHRPDHHGTA